MPERTGTGFSVRAQQFISRRTRTMSLREQAEQEGESSQSAPMRHQQKLPCYTGLTWAIIQEYLEKKWPGEKFPTWLKKTEDDYIFETPEPLTQDELDEIKSLRQTPNTRHPSVSPEPPAQPDQSDQQGNG